jgi:hypothetical protein
VSQLHNNSFVPGRVNGIPLSGAKKMQHFRAIKLCLESMESIQAQGLPFIKSDEKSDTSEVVDRI